MIKTMFHKSRLLVICLAVALGACSAGPRVTTVQNLSESADAPYDNILVVFLFSKFDTRRYLETEVVKKLSSQGATATASTSLMDSRTPATRNTFVKMAEEINADAVLVTHLVSLETKTKMVDISPEATYNIRPTYYYNVFSVDLQEYVEPQAVDRKHTLILGTQLYSVQSQDPVWAIESRTKIDPSVGELASYSIYTDEAEAITAQMSRDGLLAR